MNHAALAIFVKTPDLSPVKTRLAASIGREAAIAFYQRSLHCLEDLTFRAINGAHGELTAYWAVGEKEGLEHPLWRKLPRLYTGHGDLGKRLAHVYATLLKKHDHVILLGSDSPQLQPECVLQAHALLKLRCGQVIGPAEDGGYYLFGGHARLPRHIWRNTPYSTPDTCAVFAKALCVQGHLHYLKPEFDVDTFADLEKLRQSNMTSPAQMALLHWLATARKAYDFPKKFKNFCG